MKSILKIFFAIETYFSYDLMALFFKLNLELIKPILNINIVTISEVISRLTREKKQY